MTRRVQGAMDSDATRGSRRGVAAVIVALAACALAILVLTAVFPETPEGEQSPFLNAIVGCTYLALAGLILRKRPQESLGRLMLAMGLAMLLAGLAQVIGLHWSVAMAGSLDGIGTAMYLTIGLCFGLLVYQFPTGKPPSPAWRWPIRALWGSTAILSVAEIAGINPAGSTPLTVGAIALGLAYGVGLLSAFLSLGYRFWRSRDAERAQVKWFLFAVVVALIGWISGSTVGGLLAATLPQVGITIALTRYRLFDIDRIISRTASYTIVTGVLLATYVAMVAAATRLLPDLNTLSVAAATLAAAAMARPLLRRVQHAVDRRFNRARYDAERTVNSFVGRLASEVSPAVVVSDLQRVVGTALEPAKVMVWTREST